MPVVVQERTPVMRCCYICGILHRSGISEQFVSEESPSRPFLDLHYIYCMLLNPNPNPIVQYGCTLTNRRMGQKAHDLFGNDAPRVRDTTLKKSRPFRP